MRFVDELLMIGARGSGIIFVLHVLDFAEDIMGACFRWCKRVHDRVFPMNSTPEVEDASLASLVFAETGVINESIVVIGE